MSIAGQVGPALAAGNTVVVRPDGAASATVLEFARAVGDLLPPGVVDVVTGVAPRTDALPDGHRVRPAGPGHRSGVMVVLPDADLGAAVADAVTALCTAGGETGATPARLLVHESVHDEFAGRLAALLDAVVLGDPLDLATELGPLISAARRDEARAAVRRAATSRSSRTSP
ncbi:aldehyde dehydrogenase family protein [Actinomadura nitritigenes]|uniref:aldehyde dehydrogenase family protein n=1 Tax=Actinomadura nitritigenes TaxID=134602 RepID=UPI003D9415DA